MRAAFLSVLALASLSAAVPVAEECTEVHIIVARASTEAPGYGTSKTLVDMIKKVLPAKFISTEAIAYPATLESYVESFTKGVNALTERLKTYTAACPNSKLVLIGYSQGAHVIGDTLCGVGGAGEALGEKKPAPVGDEVDSKSKDMQLVQC
jgi:acetylxylan esterase